MHDPKDRRATPRRGSTLNWSIPAEILHEGQDPVPVALYLVDLSRGGLRINIDRELPVGVFTLGLDLVGLGIEGVTSLKVPCQVAWQRSLLGHAWVAGLQFVELDSSKAALVDELLARFEAPNRRLMFRLRSAFPVAVRHEGEWVYMTATDLSPLGLRVRTEPLEWLAPGTEQSVWVLLGSQWPLEPMEAAVVWRKEVWSDRIEVGFKFIDVDDEDARTIGRYIQSGEAARPEE